MNVLALTCGTGGGHNTACAAVAEPLTATPSIKIRRPTGGDILLLRAPIANQRSVCDGKKEKRP